MLQNGYICVTKNLDKQFYIDMDNFFERKDLRYAMIGSGSWATAIAKMVLENVKHINWFMRKPETTEQFEKTGHNPRYLQNVEFDTNRITFYNDIDEITNDSGILIFAVPSAYLPVILGNLKLTIQED